MTYNMIKIQIFLHWALHYSQIYKGQGNRVSKKKAMKPKHKLPATSIVPKHLSENTKQMRKNMTNVKEVGS
jgi:hypothetical protein